MTTASFVASFYEIATLSAILSVRVGIFVGFNPVFAVFGLPAALRAYLTGVIAVTGSFLLLQKGSGFLGPTADLLSIIVSECLIGFVLLFGSQAAFAAVHMMGRLVDNQAGLSLAVTYNPQNMTNVSIFSNLYQLVFAFTFISVAAPLFVIPVLYQSLLQSPPSGFYEIDYPVIFSFFNDVSHASSIRTTSSPAAPPLNG